MKYAAIASITLTKTITSNRPFKLNFFSSLFIGHNYEQILWQKKT